MNLNRREFKKLVQQGIQNIPKRFLKKLDNVAVVVEDEPSFEQMRRQGLRRGDLLLGLYEGVPQTKRGRYNLALPDKITIFQKPIEQLANSSVEIESLVRNTVWHELAHHFGLDELRVRKAEQRKRKVGK